MTPSMRAPAHAGIAGPRPRSRSARAAWKAAGLALAAASWPQPLYGHGGVGHEPLPFDALVTVFGMINWTFRVDIVLVLALAAGVYLRGWIRLRRQAAGAATLSGLALYLGGIAALLTALVSPVDRLAAERLSMHMVQHILLLMVAPLGILLANPFAAVVWGLPAGIRERFAGLFREGAPVRSALSGLTFMPVAWTLYVVNLWAWHHPALYQAALRHWWLHDLEHWLFFATAVLFWWPIVNAAPLFRPGRPPRVENRVPVGGDASEHPSRHGDLPARADPVPVLRRRSRVGGAEPPSRIRLWAAASCGSAGTCTSSPSWCWWPAGSLPRTTR